MKTFLSQLALFYLVGSTSAFSTPLKVPRQETKLDLTSRREAFFGVAGLLAVGLVATEPALALNTIPADNEIIKESRAVVGLLDVNNSAITEYMRYPGMYPTIAGKISNNGPYASVKDLKRSKLLSKAEISKLSEYEKYLTATPATGLDPMRGRDPYRRSFNE